MVSQVRRWLGHAPGVARGADTTALAGEGDEEVVTAVLTAGAGKAVRKDAALQVFAKRLLNVPGRFVALGSLAPQIVKNHAHSQPLASPKVKAA